MPEFPDQPMDVRLLNEHLAPLNLPGFIGAARFSRRRNANGAMERASPYIVVKCDSLTSAQMRKVRAVLAKHAPEGKRQNKRRPGA